MAEFIKVYEEAVSTELCDRIVAALDNAIEQSPSATSDIDEPWRRCHAMHIPANGVEGTDALAKELVPLFQSFLVRYAEDVRGGSTLRTCTVVEKPNLIRYEPLEGKFHLHADNFIADSCTRQLSIILYVNDVESGGKTVFPRYDIAVAPKKGSLLLFPPHWNYEHYAEPPVSGRKYIVVSWLHFPHNSVIYPYYCL